MDLALNNLLWLLCYKTKQNKTKTAFIKITRFGIKWLEKGCLAVKQNNQPTKSDEFIIKKNQR